MKIKILLVDDTKNILTAFSFGLKKRGFDVYTANNGDKAYNLAMDVIPDIIVMDNKMPGISGWETARKLKENPKTSHIPVIGLTAFAGENEMKKGSEAGIKDILLKPVYFDDLIKTISKYVVQE